MERKIGEIFEHNGEWYQCVVAMQGCRECSFRTQDYCTRHSECMSTERSDKTSVIYKKLEKVGEPYVGNNGTFQSYKLAMPIYGYIPDQIIGFTTTEVVIKQNEEDMEEGKLDTHMEKVIDEAAQKLGDEISKQLIENLNKQRMKPFNLEDAKAGRPVCTRDGRKARIICFDAKFPKTGNIVTLVEKENGEEVTLYHYDDGHCSIGRAYALMMLPEKKEGWIIVSKNATIYDSLEDAKKSFDSDKELCICKVEWEE